MHGDSLFALRHSTLLLNSFDATCRSQMVVFSRKSVVSGPTANSRRCRPRPCRRRRTWSPCRSVPLRRLSSRMMLAVSLAPVHPRGCPSAIAPPLALTRAGSSSPSWITASDCAAKASFNSMTSMSLELQSGDLQDLWESRTPDRVPSLPACSQRWQSRRSAPAASVREPWRARPT